MSDSFENDRRKEMTTVNLTLEKLYDFSEFVGKDKIYLEWMINSMITKGWAGECNKSKRVAVVFGNLQYDLVIGCNSPPDPFTCFKNEECKKVCSKICMHAEERVIRGAAEINLRKYNEFLSCVHLKIVNKTAVPSGNPSCHTCAKQLLDYTPIKYMYLFHETGWKRYTTLEFFTETAKNCGISLK